MKFHGTVDGPEVEAVVGWQIRWAEERSHVFTLCDLTTLKGATVDAQRRLRSTDDRNVNITSVVFGASFAMRILVEVATRAALFLRGIVKTRRIFFFSTEAEARAFIAQERRRIEKRASEGIEA